MADEKQVALLRESVEKWNAWRREHPEIAPDLRDADLRGMNLSGAKLTKADAKGANLLVANLSRTNLSGADVSGAGFYWALLNNTNLTDTNLEHAAIGTTIFADVDLSVAKGLEHIKHAGPSTIGIDTLYRSKGQIPEVFLRGAGIQDKVIEFAKSLGANSSEFFSCFISYSTKDQPFADRLYTDLQANGVRCWCAPHDAQRGRRLHEQIDEAIRLHDKLLLILSPDSMSSDWVRTEITKARKRERLEKTDVLFPIRLVPYDAIRDWECFDADTGADTAREIRQYFIADFTTWKDHDAYQREFDLLLLGLKQGRRPKAPLLS